ncbi:MAG: CRISPR system precrRNA processing endoribonuclease RAMP protein Cas6 [Chloroflexi bacterium]|nr:CRISPR system precrRNA processing endoribonuclease RAMP protein Cas6 [Chloroflexota bacterium]
MIPVTTLHFHLRSAQPLDFGRNPGSSVRGALYEALRSMYDTGLHVRDHLADERNPVSWLLSLEDAATSGGKDAPRPIAIRPLQNGFGLSFYGRALDYIPLVLSAVDGMSQVGVGPKRTRFEIDRVDAIDPLTTQATTILNEAGEQVAPLPQPPTEAAYRRFAAMLDPTRLEVTFLTPTRIVDRGSLCHTPTFRPWFQRLLERTRLISELYMPEPIWVPFRDLLTCAKDVAIVQDDTTWVEAWSGSRRQNAYQPTSGFTGRVAYQSIHTELLPWVLLGQALQVGKHTIKGGGWYTVRYQWQTI